MLDKSNVLRSDYISSVKEISAAMSDVFHTSNNLVGAVSKVKVTSWPLWNCRTPSTRNDRTYPVLHATEKPTASADKIDFNLVWLICFFSLWLSVKFSYLAVWVIVRCSFQILSSLCFSLVKVFGVCLVQQALSIWLLTTRTMMILVRELSSVQMFFTMFWVLNTVKVTLLSKHY